MPSITRMSLTTTQLVAQQPAEIEGDVPFADQPERAPGGDPVGQTEAHPLAKALSRGQEGIAAPAKAKARSLAGSSSPKARR